MGHKLIYQENISAYNDKMSDSQESSFVMIQGFITLRWLIWSDFVSDWTGDVVSGDMALEVTFSVNVGAVRTWMDLVMKTKTIRASDWLICSKIFHYLPSP
jgi:hypothetical protein